MKAIVQRVCHAGVKVAGETVGEINRGFLILLGIAMDDKPEDIDYLVAKISLLRVFADADGKMNLDLKSINGQCLVISQFTLMANTKKGNRPSFVEAAPPALAEKMYHTFCEKLSSNQDRPVEKGIFGADMKVSLLNDGPVTLMYDTKNK